MDELESVELPLDELFYLQVNDDNIKYEFLIRFSSSNKNVICLGSGAYSPKESISPPIFRRHTWQSEFEESVIYYNDPTLYNDPDLLLGWGVGKNDKWYLQNIAEIIIRLAKKNHIDSKNILFFGSSGGGFTALMLATIIKKSSVLVNNPQMFLFNYLKAPFNKMIDSCFDNSDLDKILKKYKYRFDVVELFKREKYMPQISYVVNINSENDILNQLIPFINSLSSFEYFNDQLSQYGSPLAKVNILLYQDERGHGGIFSTRETINMIKNHFNENNELASAKQIKLLKNLLCSKNEIGPKLDKIEEKKYRISIIIPIFNVEDYLREALESVVRQTIGFECLEVIMVNDCSTDNSARIMEEYASKYDNFIAINLQKNSGAAGKPRNIGMEKAKSDYLMFLDPDDYFVDNACENLYKKINEEKVDIVFGKYEVEYENGDKIKPSFQLFNSDVHEIKALNDEDKKIFFGAPPSIWTKIFKKKFVRTNKIIFPENIPAQDLVFFVHSLIKANGVVYINKNIVKYRKRMNNNKSISFNRNKKYMLGLTQAYKETYYVCYENKEEFFPLIIKNHLLHWTRQFVLSDLRTSEKEEVLKSSWLLFDKYYQYNLNPPQHLVSFFECVKDKRYDDAILAANRLINSMKNLESSPSSSESNKENRKLLMLCDKVPVELGGLARVVLNRSKVLSKKGYDVDIITIEPDNDYEVIESELKKRGQLSQDVNLINIYNYYKNKNTGKISLDYLNALKKSSKVDEEGYQLINDYQTKRIARYFHEGNLLMLKKWKSNGLLEFIDYFDNIGVREKRKEYIDGFLTKEISYQSYDKIRRKRHFTKDGFCYLTEMYTHLGHEKELFLFDKNRGIVPFRNSTEFHEYFLTELCKNYKKPYLICDGSGPTPTICNIGPNLAYKICQLHSNPYTGPYSFGGPMRNIGILNGIEKVDAFITLTEKQRKDIIKEFGDCGNTFTIPNFVIKEEALNLEKKVNKISIFTRISTEKRVDHAIKAFKIVVSKRKTAKLEIFGRATLPKEIDELKKIKKLINKLNLENNVFIKGYTTDVYKEMQESTATLLTSKFEGFGMVILESMLNSTPVISYDLNYGPSEVIDHEINGFLAEYNNIEQIAEYIVNLLDNPEKAKKMGAAAREKVLQQYIEEVVILQWEKIFDNIENIRKNKLKNKKNSFEAEEVLNDITKIESKAQNMAEILENKKIRHNLITKCYPLYILFSRKNKGLKNALINIKGYRSIKRKGLLDKNYYLKKNKDVKFSGMDPIIHYMYFGFKEGRKPNPSFEGHLYLKKNADVAKSNLNPLVHYSLYGQHEGRKFSKL